MIRQTTFCRTFGSLRFLHRLAAVSIHVFALLCIYFGNLTCVLQSHAAEQQECVVFSASSGWDITVFEDGSVVARYGNPILKTGNAPAGTIDYSSLKQQIETEIAAAHHIKRWMVLIGIQSPKGELPTQRPLKDLNIWNALADQLCGKLKSSKQEQFDTLLKDHPLKDLR